MREFVQRKPGIAVALGVLFVLTAMITYRPVLRWLGTGRSPRILAAHAEPPAVELEHGLQGGLRVKPEVIDRLGIKTTEARVGALDDKLTFSGTLGIDPARLEEVRARFPGEIVELGKLADESRRASIW